MWSEYTIFEALSVEEQSVLLFFSLRSQLTLALIYFPGQPSSFNITPAHIEGIKKTAVHFSIQLFCCQDFLSLIEILRMHSHKAAKK